MIRNPDRAKSPPADHALPRAEAAQILGLLLTLKLASLIVVGILLSVAGVIAAHAAASIAVEMDGDLSPPARILAETPAWGVAAGVPVILCGAIGLLHRRSAWLWAAIGTIAAAAAVIGLGVMVFGSLASLQDRLLS